MQGAGAESLSGWSIKMAAELRSCLAKLRNCAGGRLELNGQALRAQNLRDI